LQKYDPNLPQLRLLIKADVAGSLEALLDVLQTYDAQDACALDVVDVGVGVLTDDDLVMAEKFSGRLLVAHMHARSCCLPVQCAAAENDQRTMQ
jgi:translation initiation factor IF-2